MPTADFLAVILSALGVMIAILTFFLGVLAFFGWSAFRSLTEDKFDELMRRRFDANNPQYAAIVDRLVEDARARKLAEAVARGGLNEDEDEDADGNS